MTMMKLVQKKMVRKTKVLQNRVTCTWKMLGLRMHFSSSSIKDAQPSTMKGKKRKCTKDEKIEAIMSSVVKEVVNSQKVINCF